MIFVRMDQRILYYHQVLSLRYVDRRLAVVALIALALEGWMLFSDVHLFWKPPRVPSGATKVAKVLAVTRQAKARSSLQLNWFDLAPGQELFEGDEVATMDRSDAILKFVDGQTVTLEANSFLVLRSAGLAGDHTFQISLVRGGLEQTGGGEAALTAAGSRLEIEVGGRKVVAQGQASVKIESAQGGKPEIAVGGGDVSVTEIITGGIEIGRAGGPVAALAPAPPAITEVKPPLLESPSAGTVLTNPESIKLRWKPTDLSDTPTLVEVSSDEAFTVILWHAILSGETSTSFVPGRKGHFYWRATRLGEKHVPSQIASFEVRRELRAPSLARPRIERGQTNQIHPVDAPVLGHPIIHYEKESWVRRPRPSARRPWLRRLAAGFARAVDGLLFKEAAAADPEKARYLVDLSWGTVPDATAYVLQIASDDAFLHIVAEKVLTQTSFSWHTDTAGFYYWRVSGVDKDGDRGPFSEFNTFVIKGERNKQGDESSYETYLKFDEYSKYSQNIRVTWGPIFNNYYYSDVNAPYTVIYRSHSLLNGQLGYDFRLSPYYSLQASFREEKTQIGASDFESPRPDQPTQSQYETLINVGFAKRIFFPRHYFSLQAGVGATFVDLPFDSGIGDPSDPVSFTNFGFFGFYGSVGYHSLLGQDFDGALTVGGSYQNSRQRTIQNQDQDKNQAKTGTDYSPRSTRDRSSNRKRG